jgi:hypothetical protein
MVQAPALGKFDLALALGVAGTIGVRALVMAIRA